MEQITLLESVVGITRERDKKSLEYMSIATLHKYLDADALILLHISPGGTSKQLCETISLPIGACQDRLNVSSNEMGRLCIEADGEIDKCIVEGVDRSEIFDDGSVRHLFPIGQRKGIDALLLVYCKRNDAQKDRFTRAFLDIYINFLSVVDDNEHDTLTGLLNRKTFDKNIAKLIADNPAQVKPGGIRASDIHNPGDDESQVSHWLGVLDIDHFKLVNDNFGHVYGDEVLLLFSELMRKTFRSNDMLFRYGGEEFVVALSSATEEVALRAFNRFRKCVGDFDFPQVGRVTVSIGIVQIQPQDHPSMIVEKADQALYYAKEHGRNRVCSYHQLITDGSVMEREAAKNDVELF
ncbi:MAG: GGDEF domain-containing protein [Chromatiales bacterium]|nr:GGDEF domain-containing protein [Chromatiales bacterium]